MPNHFYGYVKDKFDPRDHVYLTARAPEVALPAMADLRHFDSPVRGQLNLGACTGFGLTAVREFLMLQLGHPLIQLSPKFLYYRERELEGTINEDSGASIRDGLIVLSKFGCAPEIDDPYDVNTFTVAPSDVATVDAAQFKIASYRRLLTVNDIKTCLAGGQPVVDGISIWESFESDVVTHTGFVPMPQPGEKKLGGHCTETCGYQDNDRYPGGGYFIKKNSWEMLWGDQGYFYVPYAYYDPSLDQFDAWTVRL